MEAAGATLWGGGLCKELKNQELNTQRSNFKKLKFGSNT